MNATMQTPANASSLPHQLLKPRDAAKLLAISERTLFTLTKKGELASVRMGKTVRYAQGELAAFVRKQTQAIPGNESTA
jgi:excisionase family DNA binding protein